AHGGRPAGPGSILPPVFTRWSEPVAEKGSAAPEARDAAPGPGAIPPFLDPVGGRSSAPSPAPAAPAADEEDSFPIEAFIIPEEARRALPNGGSRSPGDSGPTAWPPSTRTSGPQTVSTRSWPASSPGTWPLAMTDTAALDLAERLRRAIRDVPDFPKPGILFK